MSGPQIEKGPRNLGLVKKLINSISVAIKLVMCRPVSTFPSFSNLKIYDHSLYIYGYSLNISEILQNFCRMS